MHPPTVRNTALCCLYSKEMGAARMKSIRLSVVAAGVMLVPLLVGIPPAAAQNSGPESEAFEFNSTDDHGEFDQFVSGLLGMRSAERPT